MFSRTHNIHIFFYFLCKFVKVSPPLTYWSVSPGRGLALIYVTYLKSLETCCEQTKRAILFFSSVSERYFYLIYEEKLPGHSDTTTLNYTTL